MRPASWMAALALAARLAAAPAGASYLTPDGAIRVVGYADMREWLQALDARFAADHPGCRFDLELRGTRAAPAALGDGSSAFAPMGAVFSADQLRAYRAAVGADPLEVRVAHGSVSPRAKSGPLLIVVHPSNPLTVLTVGEVVRIFSSGGSGDELTSWGQLGAGADWSARAVHPYVLAAGTALGDALLQEKMPGRHFRPDCRAFAESDQVVAQVAADPAGIGFARANVVTPAVKALAIAERPGGPASSASAEDIVAGRYPFDRYLYIFLRPPLAPWLRDYVRLALSAEGQRALAATPQAYLPLSPAEASAERSKLD